jgi:ATP-dependent Clp protease protease subunit
MIHQPLIHGQMTGPASDIQIQAEEMLRIREVTTEILARHSGKSVEEIDKDTERDNWFAAEAAKVYGLVDIVESYR